MNKLTLSATLLLVLFYVACESPEEMSDEPAAETMAEASAEAQALLDKYTSVTLDADLSVLTERERQMIPLLIEAGQAMEEIFWVQAYGNRDSLLAAIADPGLRRFAEINYGPWDRLDDNAPFIDGVGDKPKGANLYPADITEEELEAAAAENPALKSAPRNSAIRSAATRSRSPYVCSTSTRRTASDRRPDTVHRRRLVRRVDTENRVFRAPDLSCRRK